MVCPLPTIPEEIQNKVLYVRDSECEGANKAPSGVIVEKDIFEEFIDFVKEMVLEAISNFLPV
jgi:hypothetical protein